MSVGVGVYEQQPQVSPNGFVVVGEASVIGGQEITTNGGGGGGGVVTNEVTYETSGKECNNEAVIENGGVSDATTTVLEIGKRRPEYLSGTTAEQYAQEAGCSGPKINRNNDCMDSSERLLSGQDDGIFHDNGSSELITTDDVDDDDDDEHHQTLRDISRCAPREITGYEPQHCDIVPSQQPQHQQHCEIPHQQRCDVREPPPPSVPQSHCSMQQPPQHCGVQEMPISTSRRADREAHSSEKSDVKNEIESDENASALLISLSNALNPGEAEYFDRYRPKGRPRGPKHPVWNFFKFCKSGGLTLGYMCLMCGSGFTGPPNTTNATKHLRCKHKHEYLLYFDLLEGAKHGTFFGDVHQSIRELVLKRGVKAEACSSGSNTGEGSRTNYGTMSEDMHRNHEWADGIAGSSQDTELHSFLCSALAKNSLIRYDVSNGNENSEVSSTGEVIFAASTTGDAEAAGSSAQQVSSDATGQFAGQVESFLRDYRRLEAECRRLRAEANAKDEHIKTLRLNLLEERNKRKSALILVQRALLDE